MRRFVHFELQATAAETGEPLQRWNGGPLASNEANAALDAATEAFTRALRAHGFQVGHVGYGVTASEVSDA